MKIELKNIRLNEDISFDSYSYTANLYVENKKVATVHDDGMGSGLAYENVEPENRLLLHNANEYAKQALISRKDDSINPDSLDTQMVSLELYLYDLLYKYVEQLDKRKLNAIMKRGIAYGDGLTSYRFVKFSNSISDLLKTDKGISTVEWVLKTKVLPKIEKGERILNENVPEAIIKRAGFSEDQYIKKQPVLKTPTKSASQSRKPKGL